MFICLSAVAPRLVLGAIYKYLNEPLQVIYVPFTCKIYCSVKHGYFSSLNFYSFWYILCENVVNMTAVPSWCVCARVCISNKTLIGSLH